MVSSRTRIPDISAVFTRSCIRFTLVSNFDTTGNSTFRGIHTYDLKKFILIYTIGNTESNNWYKLNPEQYRARPIIQIIHLARLRIEWKRWLFKFSRLSVSPLNYRHYIRQMMNEPNESIAISCNFQLDLCLYTVTRVIHTSMFAYFSCSCLRFDPSKIHAQMFRLYIYIFFLLNDMIIIVEYRQTWINVSNFDPKLISRIKFIRFWNCLSIYEMEIINLISISSSDEIKNVKKFWRKKTMMKLPTNCNSNRLIRFLEITWRSPQEMQLAWWMVRVA